MADPVEETEMVSCDLCHNPCGSCHSMEDWIIFTTIRNVLIGYIPEKADEWKNSDGIICNRCYNAMYTLVKKKQEAREAENFVQFLAKSAPTNGAKTDKETKAHVTTLSVKNTTTPPKGCGQLKGNEEEGNNPSVIIEQFVTQTRSGRKYAKRKLANSKNEIPEKSSRKPENDSILKQMVGDGRGNLKTPTGTQKIQNIKNTKKMESVNHGQGRGKQRTQLPKTSQNTKAGDDTKQNRGRGRPRKLSLESLQTETLKKHDVSSTVYSRVVSSTSQDKGDQLSEGQKITYTQTKNEMNVGQQKSSSGGTFKAKTVEKPGDNLSESGSFQEVIDVRSCGAGTEMFQELGDNGIEVMADGDYGTQLPTQREVATNTDPNELGISSDSDEGEITPDHSYHISSRKRSEKENPASILHSREMDIDQITENDVDDDFRQTDMSGFSDRNYENEELFAEDNEDDDWKSRTCPSLDSQTKYEGGTKDKTKSATQRMTTRIGSGTLAKKSVVISRKLISRKDRIIAGGKSLLTGNKVLLLRTDKDQGKNSKQKKVVFLKASDLKAKKLQAKVKESVRQSVRKKKVKLLAYKGGDGDKCVIPRPKVKRVRDRKNKGNEVTVKPEIWTCRECKEVKYSESEMKTHITTEHNIKDAEQIQQCMSNRIIKFVSQKKVKIAPKMGLPDLFKTREEVSYTCTICNMIITRENNAVTHVRMTHQKTKADALNYIRKDVRLVESNEDYRLSENDVNSTGNLKKQEKNAEDIKAERLKRRRMMRYVQQHFLTKVQKWKCKMCGIVYVSHSAVRRHIVKQHIVSDSDVKENIIRILVDRNTEAARARKNIEENVEAGEMVKSIKGEGSETVKSPESFNLNDLHVRGMEFPKKGVISGRGRLKHGHNKPWRCGLCPISYFHKCDVHRHLIQKHGLQRDDAKSYVIQEKWQEELNKKFFATRVEVYTINDEDKMDFEMSADMEDEEELDPYNESLKPWKCIKCGKKVPTKKAALRHMRFPHEIYGPWARYHVRQIAAEEGSKSTKLEDEFHLDRDVLCVLCGRDYTSQVQAWQHIKDCHPDISETMVADVLLRKSGGSKLIVLSLPEEVTRTYHIDSNGRIREVDQEKVAGLKQKLGVWDKKTFNFFDNESVESDAEMIDGEQEIPLINSSEELNITHANIYFLNWENYSHEEGPAVSRDKKPWECNRCQKGLANKLVGVQHVAHVHDINGPWARHFLRKNDEWDGLSEGTIRPERDWLCVYCGRHYKTNVEAYRHVKGWHPSLTETMQESLVLQKSGGCKGIVLSTGAGDKLKFLIDSLGRMKEVDNRSIDFEDFERRYSFNCRQEDNITDMDDFDPQFVDTDASYFRHLDQVGCTGMESSQTKQCKKMVSLLTSKVAYGNKTWDPTCQENVIASGSVTTSKEQKTHVYKCSNPISQKKEYLCTMCPVVFSNYKHASYHRMYHRHVVRWRCRRCGEAFYYISDLTEHISKLHNQSRLSIVVDMEEIQDNKPYVNVMTVTEGTQETSSEVAHGNMTDNKIVTTNHSVVTCVESKEMTGELDQAVSSSSANQLENQWQDMSKNHEDKAGSSNEMYETNESCNIELTDSDGCEKVGESDALDFESGNQLNQRKTKKGKSSCEVCGLFVPVDKVQSHRTLFHGVKGYRCMECQQDFITLPDFQGHLSGVHEVLCDNDKRIHPCIICNTVWRNRPDLLSHLDRHKFDGCRCSICGKTFDNMNGLKSHMSVHACSFAKGNETHTCLICGKSISSTKNFLKHTRNHYDEHHKVFQCQICKKFLKTRSRLADHMKNHNHEEMLCPYCAKQFTSRTNFNRHINFHENPEKFSCQQCSLQFSTLTGLRRHQKFHHTTGQGKTVCHICGKNLRHLKWHIRNVHSDENQKSKQAPKKNRKCEFCGKVFKLPHMMERHRVVHTGEKPFQCEYCHKTFSFRTSYKSHLNTHPEHKPYKCMVCGIQFQLEKDFLQHRGHCRNGDTDKEFPFQCEVCQRVFRSLRSLRTHLDRKHQMEKHSKLPGDMRHYCQICQKGFFYKDTLNRHMYSAHRDRNDRGIEDDNIIIEETNTPQEDDENSALSMYKCDICGDVFNLLQQLNEHVDTHHTEPVGGLNIKVYTSEHDSVVGPDLESSSVITLEHEQAAQLLSHLQIQMGDGQEFVNVIIPSAK